ncbi:MAG TPA: hypothetical protein VG275_09360 [Solirubrobacteraceae bacterium]|jgi:hypothetical protein|nr:hypothetical protein [Solirubrobacteraceae bacterium]
MASVSSRAGRGWRSSPPKAAAATSLALAGLTLTALAATALAATALAAPATLTGFLLRSGEQTGFRVRTRPATQTSVAAFVKSSGGTKRQKLTETAQLLKEGFVAASDEQLGATHGRQGFSLAIEFTSPAGAEAGAGDRFTTAFTQQKGAKLSRFRIKAVPSARGVLARYPGGTSTANVYWTEGQCAFGSGDLVAKQAGSVVPPVVAGVKRLYKRTGGTCP